MRSRSASPPRVVFLISGYRSSTQATINTVISTLLEHPPAAIAEGSVRSADGTRIGFFRLGEGPAVIFVHGSISTHTDWMPVAKLLSRSFNCFVIDRRGRGRSGPGNFPYSIVRECEDIAAVASAAGPGAALVGHSYGAICTFEAALRIPVRRMVVYEPPFPVGGPVAGQYLAPYAAAIERGDLDAALEIGFTRFTQFSTSAIVRMRSSRAWPRQRVLAPTWTRELQVMDSISPDIERYCSLACPIMLLAGSESPEHPMKDSVHALTQAIPGIRVETLVGHAHVGLRTAPTLVAPLIGHFLSA